MPVSESTGEEGCKLPDRDGFTTAAESQRLEREADELLKADARERGFIRPNGRGMSEYARASGITTKKTLETTYKHEVVGWDPLGLNPPRANLAGDAAEPLVASEKDFVRPSAAKHTRGGPARE